MRIGFFTDTYQQINGVTTVIHSLEKQLRKKGHEVYIFAPREKGGNKDENLNLFTSESIRFLGNPEYRWAIFPVYTIRDTDKLNLDIIHIHSPISMGLSGLFNGKRLGIPILGTVHTLIPEFWNDFVKKLLPYVALPIVDQLFKPLFREVADIYSLFMERLTWRYFARFFNQCDLVTVPSTYAKMKCIENGINNPVIAPNGVDFSRFQFLEEPYNFYERWGINKNDTIFLSVGRLSEEKNLEVILNSAKNILKSYDNIKFLIVGEGQQGTRLRNLVKKLEIQDSVIFTGYVDYKELGLFYKYADLLIVASLYESFGLTVIEAMYFGCPVLGVKSGGIMDIINPNYNGLFFNGTSEDLTKKISYILENPTILKTFKENCQETSKKFDISNSTNTLIQLYEQLLNDKKHG